MPVSENALPLLSTTRIHTGADHFGQARRGHRLCLLHKPWPSCFNSWGKFRHSITQNAVWMSHSGPLLYATLCGMTLDRFDSLFCRYGMHTACTCHHQKSERTATLGGLWYLALVSWRFFRSCETWGRQRRQSFLTEFGRFSFYSGFLCNARWKSSL